MAISERWSTIFTSCQLAIHKITTNKFTKNEVPTINVKNYRIFITLLACICLYMTKSACRL